MTIEVGEAALINIDLIDTEDRARQEMGDLNELEFSMKESGVINPLSVKRKKDGRFLLLAGERRLLILRKNENKQVLVRVYPDDISPLQIKIIEKSENFYRKDMEFWEFDNLVREIHLLQQELHGEKAPGPGHDGWTTEDTADMMNLKSKASVSTAVKRAEAREAFPDLFDHCKTQKDANNIIQKMDEALIKEVLAQKIESDGVGGTVKQLADGYILGDFFERVKEVPDGIMHLVEIDPPYAIELEKAKKAEGESIYSGEDYNEVEYGDYLSFLLNTFSECYRVMTEHSWLICWFAPEPWFEEIRTNLVTVGFETTRMCGLWTKPSGQSKRPEIHLANSYEMFFYAWKGRPAMNKPGRSNNFQFSPVPPQKKTHPTERPVELTTEIYDTFAFTGSRVLIPFLGSGNGLISAHQLGMSALGYELSKGYRDSFLVKVHNME